jgi:ribosomal protein L11 methyltransferase
MTSWLRVRFRVGRTLAEPLNLALEEAGAIAVSIEGREDEHVLQAATEETALWEECTVTGLFAGDSDLPALVSKLREQLAPASLPEPLVEPLADSDWAESWKEHYHPFLVAPGIWICPSWLSPPDPDAVTLLLDPGMAFGTGEHPTTALCLAWLTEQNLSGVTLVDFGTGSGILAMAALKLGAARATGVDIDTKAVEIARENLARNGLGERFTACTPDELPASTSADIVLANILANPLRELAPRLIQLLKPDGQLVLSGMLAGQADEVAAAYAGAVYFHARRERNGWILLAGRRRALLP